MVVAHGIIDSEFPNSIACFQWNVCIFQLICMSPSYDHFLTENNGYLPLTSCGHPESNTTYRFLFKIWKIKGCFFISNGEKTCWIILRARKRIFSLYWGLWKVSLKAPRKKNAYENVVCWSRLLQIIAYHYWRIKYRSKQCGPRTDCSYRSSLIWLHTIFHNGSGMNMQ